MLFMQQQHLCLYAYNEVSCVSGLSIIYLVAPMMDGWMVVKASLKEGETMRSDW